MFPRWYSARVISWNFFEPAFVKLISTSGPFVVVSMSARVPFSFRSFPVIWGTGLAGGGTWSMFFVKR